MAISIQRNQGTSIPVVYVPEPTWKTKILDVIRKIWESIKNFFCCRTPKPLTEVQIAASEATQSMKRLMHDLPNWQVGAPLGQEQKSLLLDAANKAAGLLSKAHSQSLNALRNEVDKYRTGIPLTEKQKADLLTKKNNAEGVFNIVEDSLRRDLPIEVPSFVAYQTTGLQAEVQALLNGQALPLA